MSEFKVNNYIPDKQEAVISLWRRCGLVVPWNDPERDIGRKLKASPDLFFVAESNDKIIGSCMAGYDGHRGWVYYLAVDPDYRRQGIGRLLMDEAEKRLLALGCPKIDLMVRENNTAVLEFYQRIGYNADKVKVLSKRLIKDD